MTYEKRWDEKRWAGIRWGELRWDEVWSVKSAVWSVGREECSVKCGVWRKQWEVRSVDCEVWSVECGVWSVKCGLGRVQCGVWSVKRAVWSVECGVWSVECEAWSAKWSFKCDMWNRTPLSKNACTHGLGWRTAPASSIDEKGLIYIFKATSAPPRAGTTGSWGELDVLILKMTRFIPDLLVPVVAPKSPGWKPNKQSKRRHSRHRPVDGLKGLSMTLVLHVPPLCGVQCHEMFRCFPGKSGCFFAVGVRHPAGTRGSSESQFAHVSLCLPLISWATLFRATRRLPGQQLWWWECLRHV